MTRKLRLDVLLVERGLCKSRSAAGALILAGKVYSGTQRLDKPGHGVPEDLELRVEQPPRYVSRGGDKLAGALGDLDIDVGGKVWVDVGASTGGFSDCLLQHGARKIYAVDVGRGQLAQSLVQDARVINRERTNARDLAPQDFEEAIDGAVVDASFIGLGKLLPAIAGFLREGGELLAMIKPQFEAGKELASKHRGVIRDPDLRREIVEGVLLQISAHGFQLLADAPCRVAGPKGNVEHFVWARRQDAVGSEDAAGSRSPAETQSQAATPSTTQAGSALAAEGGEEGRDA